MREKISVVDNLKRRALLENVLLVLSLSITAKKVYNSVLTENITKEKGIEYNNELKKKAKRIAELTTSKNLKEGTEDMTYVLVKAWEKFISGCEHLNVYYKNVEGGFKEKGKKEIDEAVDLANKVHEMTDEKWGSDKDEQESNEEHRI